MIHGLGKRKRLQRIGKIRIGEKDERGLPRSLDYFRIVVDSGFEEVTEDIWKKYGKKPKKLVVYLPASPEKDEVWSPWYRRYGRNGLLCKGDGLVGHEVGQNGEMVERPCAEKGCPFAKPDEKGRIACKPTGILSLKIYEIDHPGTFHLTMRGWTQVDLAHNFLMSLVKRHGEEVAGQPFSIHTERVKGQKGVFTRIIFKPEDLPRVEVIEEEVEEAEGLVVTDDQTGEVLGTPEVSGAAAAMATMINDAIKSNLLVGAAKKRALQTLATINTLTEEERQEKFDQLAEFLTGIENTLDDPVADHPEDQRMAESVWQRLTPQDFATLQLDSLGAPEEMTRRQVRDAIAYLEKQK